MRALSDPELRADGGAQRFPSSGGDAKYQTLFELGRGGMATTVLAARRGPAGFRKLAVLKRMHSSLAAEPEALAMFMSEARLAARIDHPNVVHTYDVVFDDATSEPVIAMEYIEGQTLDSIVRADESFPLRLHLLVLAHVLEGLHAAHELPDFDGTPLGIVHRDVSPHNVMVGYDGHAKIVDFGIAKSPAFGDRTATGVVKGKSAYMSPEQFTGDAVDRRADVFAVGVILWQALTGRRLFRGQTDREIYDAIVKGELARPSSIATNVPAALDAVCMKALASDRAERHATALAMLEAIEAALAETPALRAGPRDLSAYLAERFGPAQRKVRAAVEAAFAAMPEATETALAAPAVVTRSRPPRLASWAIAVLAGLLAFFGLRAALSAARAPAAQAPDGRTTTVEISASETATVSLDGAKVDGTPARGTFPRDRARHLLRVEAEGRAPHVEWLSFDVARIVVSVDLARADTSPSASVEAVAPAPLVPSAAASANPVARAKERTPKMDGSVRRPEPLAPASNVPVGVASAAPGRKLPAGLELDKENPFGPKGEPRP